MAHSSRKTRAARLSRLLLAALWPCACICALPACRRAPKPADSKSPAAAASADSGIPGLATCTAPKRPRGRLVEREKSVAVGIRDASKLVKKDQDRELWETPYGQFWVVAGNFETLCMVFAEQEHHIYGDAATGVHKGDIVLDCGAHFGGYVHEALELGAKLVVAIELAPQNVACLRDNFASEIAAGRVIVYPKGVWDKDDQVTLYKERLSWGDRVATEKDVERRAEMVSVTTIDKIVSELHLERVDFIKMDIEGAEANALGGATATLRTFKPRMALAAYHHGTRDWQELPAIALKAQPTYDVCLWGVDAGWGNQTLFFR